MNLFEVCLLSGQTRTKLSGYEILCMLSFLISGQTQESQELLGKSRKQLMLDIFHSDCVSERKNNSKTLFSVFKS